MMICGLVFLLGLGDCSGFNELILSCTADGALIVTLNGR